MCRARQVRDRDGSARLLAARRWLGAYWIILLQGLASALPWNVFLTETEFFNLRAHQPPFTKVLANNFESVNLLSSMAGQMAGFLVYIPLHHVMSLDMQVLWPQMLTLGVMLGAVALTLRETVPGDWFMALILGAQLLMGIMNATITGGVYHMASWLPPSYIQGMSLGIGFSGTAVAAISFLTLWAVPRGSGPPSLAAVTPAAFSYFLGSAVIVFLAVLTYYSFFMLPFVHNHSLSEELAEWSLVEVEETQPQMIQLRRESATFLRCKTRRTTSGSLSASLSLSQSLLGAGSEAALLNDTDEPQKLETGNPGGAAEHSRPLLADSETRLPGTNLLEGPTRTSHHSSWCPPWVESAAAKAPDKIEADSEASEGEAAEENLSLGAVLHRMWGYNLVAGFGCMVSIALFPGVTSTICSEHNGATVAPCHPNTPKGRFFGDLFVPFVFLVINAADVIGRLAAGMGRWSRSEPPMWLLGVYAVSRVILALPLLFCNVVTPSPWRLPHLLRSDAWTIALATALGATNGHLQSLTLMHAPQALPKSARDRTGPIINFALAAGTTAGSILSFILTYFLQTV